MKAPAHDPLCQYKDQWDAGLSVNDVSGDCPGCSFIAKVRTAGRADLRAQVGDLFVLRLLSGDWVSRADVLALIDGNSE